MTESITGIDSLATVIRSYDRCADGYDEHAEVINTIGQRLMGRLELLAANPSVIVDLGCGTGGLLAGLRARYAKSWVVGIDASVEMLRYSRQHIGRWRNKAGLICADAHQIPLHDASVDLVVSNLLLPWCQNHHRVFLEIHRILKPGGALLFTSAGPDTFIEYRRFWELESAQQRNFGLIDMHDLGDAMLAAGFSAPVLDRENLTLDYPSVEACEREMRATGIVNLAALRRRGLLSPTLRKRISASNGSARFQVTLELVQGHAWKGDLPTQTATDTGGTAISFSAFRQSLRRKRDDYK